MVHTSSLGMFIFRRETCYCLYRARYSLTTKQNRVDVEPFTVSPRLKSVAAPPRQIRAFRCCITLLEAIQLVKSDEISLIYSKHLEFSFICLCRLIIHSVSLKSRPRPKA